MCDKQSVRIIGVDLGTTTRMEEKEVFYVTFALLKHFGDRGDQSLIKQERLENQGNYTLSDGSSTERHPTLKNDTMFKQIRG